MFNPLVDAVNEFGTAYIDFRGFVHNGRFAFADVEGGNGVVFVLECLYFRVKVLPHFAEIVIACDVFAAKDGGGEGGAGSVGGHGVVPIVGALFVSL